MSIQKMIYFAHGKESGPVGSKILAMSEVAEALGYSTESPDYQGLEEFERIEKLISLKPEGNPLVLVGSSMGAYISTVASKTIQPIGLFLLAPAFYIPGYREQSPKPYSSYIEIVHGWKDELIPPISIFNYSDQYSIPLHLLDSDHRLSSVITDIKKIFHNFLLKIEDNYNPK